MVLDEAGPDEIGLAKVGWTSFNWMICPVPIETLLIIRNSTKTAYNKLGDLKKFWDGYW